MSDTIRAVGFEGEITCVQALAPVAIQDATPVLSSAVDLSASTYIDKRLLLVASVKETTATAHTVAFTITESATSGGSYTAATVSGTLSGATSDTVVWASFRRNDAMPFIKVTATGSHADVDVIATAVIVAIGDL